MWCEWDEPYKNCIEKAIYWNMQTVFFVIVPSYISLYRQSLSQGGSAVVVKGRELALKFQQKGLLPI